MAYGCFFLLLGALRDINKEKIMNEALVKWWEEEGKRIPTMGGSEVAAGIIACHAFHAGAKAATQARFDKEVKKEQEKPELREKNERLEFKRLLAKYGKG